MKLLSEEAELLLIHQWLECGVDGHDELKRTLVKELEQRWELAADKWDKEQQFGYFEDRLYAQAKILDYFKERTEQIINRSLENQI